VFALTGAIMGIKPLGETLRSLGGAEARPPSALSDPALPAASLNALVTSARQAFPGWQQIRLHAPRPVHEMDARHAEDLSHAATESIPFHS